MNITIKGRILSKKNSKRIVCRGKRPILLTQEKYKAWHSGAMMQLLEQGVPKSMMKRCSISMDIYYPDNRVADLDNKSTSILDLLTDYGVIEDDRWQCVTELHLRGYYDKEEPRVEVTIEEI